MQHQKEEWIHGTEVYFEEWLLPLPKPKHKGGLEAHSALFFTTSREYALGAANHTEGLVSTSIKPDARVLDMENCTTEESEAFRLQALKKDTSSKNCQVGSKEYWLEGWRTGSIMKYAPSSKIEKHYLQQKLHLALNYKGTHEGNAASNELQLLTRNNIEDLVCAASDLGYDCVIGNEIDTLHKSGGKTYKIMFANNVDSITDPVWLSKPTSIDKKLKDTPKKQSKVKKKNKHQKLSRKKNRKK